MIIFIVALCFSSLLFAQNNSDKALCKKGIIYPEDHAIQYFDPYLLDMQKKVSDEHISSLKRLSVFLHQTLFINDGRLEVYLLPIETYFDASREDTLIITLPSNMDDDDSDLLTSRWKFHNGRLLHIKDIFYSIKYAIGTGMYLPSMYKEKVDIVFDEDNEQIVIIYDSKYNQVNIKKHFKDLIVLPFEHTQKFVEDNFNKNSDGYAILKEYIRKKIGTQYQSNITNIVSAGPFKVSSQQKGGDLLLKRFEEYEEKSSNGNIDIIKIRHMDIKSEWWGKLLDHKVNIVPELLNVEGSSSEFKVKSRESTEIASLLINYKSKKSNQLNVKRFREALTYLIDKEEYKFSQLNNRAHLLDGPLIRSDSGYSSNIKKHDYNIEKFKRIMEQELGYKLKWNSEAKTEIYGKEINGNWEWAEFSLLFRSGQGVPATQAAICKQLSRDFINNGIFLRRDAKSLENSFQKSLITRDFDFVYMITKINSGESIEKYYGKNGSKNYGHYNPSDELQKYLEECEENCHNDYQEKRLRTAIFEMIANDYANIFLWSPFSFYAYNKDYIEVNKRGILPTEKFFNLPHKSTVWNMVEDEW
tara:strand:+ start:30788 stop:32545 length:1758 start_codon:yes stop_codon:yes gene_type:complete